MLKHQSGDACILFTEPFSAHALNSVLAGSHTIHMLQDSLHTSRLSVLGMIARALLGTIAQALVNCCWKLAIERFPWSAVSEQHNTRAAAVNGPAGLALQRAQLLV